MKGYKQQRKGGQAKQQRRIGHVSFPPHNKVVGWFVSILYPSMVQFCSSLKIKGAALGIKCKMLGIFFLRLYRSQKSVSHGGFFFPRSCLEVCCTGGLFCSH